MNLIPFSSTREYKNNYQREWRRRNPEKRKQYKKKWHEDNPGANSTQGWKRRLLLVYGLTPEQYNLMFLAQQGLCAICNQPETRKNKFGEIVRLSVDHNHTTGKPRKLLCARCNVLLGQSEENISLLYKMIKYLEEEK